MFYILVDGVRDSAVTVNLLESYFPFIMAFLAIHGNHRKEGGPTCESEFFCIFNGFPEMLVPVEK